MERSEEGNLAPRSTPKQTEYDAKVHDLWQLQNLTVSEMWTALGNDLNTALKLPHTQQHRHKTKHIQTEE